MSTYSGILAWKIPRAEEPGELQSMGPQRVRYGLAEQQNRAYNFTEQRINLNVCKYFLKTLPFIVFYEQGKGLPCGSVVKNPPAMQER